MRMELSLREHSFPSILPCIPLSPGGMNPLVDLKRAETSKDFKVGHQG